MTFEPAARRTSVGNIIGCVATDKGHDAELTCGMIPEGTGTYVDNNNNAEKVTMIKPDVFGVRGKPHFGVAMVRVVDNEATGPIGVRDRRMPKATNQHFQGLLSRLSDQRMQGNHRFPHFKQSK